MTRAAHPDPTRARPPCRLPAAGDAAPSGGAGARAAARQAKAV